MKTFDETSSDPAVHSDHIQQQISALIDHLREDIRRVNEPQFKALLETSAEVLAGLRAAFQHYSEHREPAWQPSGAR